MPPTTQFTDYGHIIWDWNGTLMNDSWLCHELINWQLAKRTLPTLSFERYREIFDFPIIDYYRRCGFDLEAEAFEVVASEFMDEYDRRRYECDLHPEVIDLLSRINDQAISQSILSAYEHERLLAILAHYQLDDRFTHIMGQDDHYAAGKVAQGHRLLKELPRADHPILLIGDTTHDADVAHELGIDCVLIANGHQPKDKLRATGVPVYTSLTEWGKDNGAQTKV